MKKKLSLLLIISFFSVQVLSLLHMAEHDFEKHSHNGQVCEIYIHAKQTGDPIPVTEPELAPVFVAISVSRDSHSDIPPQQYRLASARAPPRFS